MIGSCRTFLLSHGGEWSLPAADDWRFLFHNNYHPHCSNINLLWFYGPGRYPRIVTKLYRTPEILQREYDNLQRAYAAAPNWVPEPLHFGVYGGFWTLWMRGVPGLRVRPGDLTPAALESLIDTVAAIHNGVRLGSTRHADRYARIVSTPLKTVEQFGSSAPVAALCRELAASCSPTWLASMPVIPQHGDLFISNVLSHADRWFVVDWETFGTVDLPFYDVVTLLFSLLRAGAETPDGWEPSLCKLIPGLVCRYAQAVTAPGSQLALLLPLSIINWFHLLWVDGRQEFAQRMYKTIEDYANHRDRWEEVFVPA